MKLRSLSQFLSDRHDGGDSVGGGDSVMVVMVMGGGGYLRAVRKLQ